MGGVVDHHHRAAGGNRGLRAQLDVDVIRQRIRFQFNAVLVVGRQRGNHRIAVPIGADVAGALDGHVAGARHPDNAEGVAQRLTQGDAMRMGDDAARQAVAKLAAAFVMTDAEAGRAAAAAIAQRGVAVNVLSFAVMTLLQAVIEVFVLQHRS